MKKMDTQIQIVLQEEIYEDFLSRIRAWATEVLERTGLLSPPPHLTITIWKTVEKFRAFDRVEREALGIATGEEAEFLATHDAWREYPRIHVCQERLIGIPDAIIQGVVHYEVGHVLHHDTPEFYTFRFSSRLQEAGRTCGMDLPLLQQCVYFLSVAIKDQEVIQGLGKMGLGFSQRALLQYLLLDTQEERQTWEVVQGSSALRKIAFAAFLKTLLPVEVLISAGIEEDQALKNQWNEAYAWLPERERKDLFPWARYVLSHEAKIFQERLEQAAIRLIADPSL